MPKLQQNTPDFWGLLLCRLPSAKRLELAEILGLCYHDSENGDPCWHNQYGCDSPYLSSSPPLVPSRGGLFLFPGTATALTLSRAVGILNPLPFSNLATERRCRLWKSSQASLWPSQQVYLAIASASGLMVTARASKHKEPPGVAAPGGSLFCVSALVTSQASLACGYYTTPI